MTAQNSDIQEVAKRIAILRLAMGYTNQNAFAQTSGLSASELNHFESSRRALNINAANKLRMRWGVTLDWLYHGDMSGLSVDLAKLLSPDPSPRNRRQA